MLFRVLKEILGRKNSKLMYDDFNRYNWLSPIKLYKTNSLISFSGLAIIQTFKMYIHIIIL